MPVLSHARTHAHILRPVLSALSRFARAHRTRTHAHSHSHTRANPATENPPTPARHVHRPGANIRRCPHSGTSSSGLEAAAEAGGTASKVGGRGLGRFPFGRCQQRCHYARGSDCTAQAVPLQLALPPASRVGVVFNLPEPVIGVGVLAIRSASSEQGLIAPILLLVIGALTERSLCLMIKAGDLCGTTGYSDTVAKCYGGSMSFFADIMIVVMNFGSAVAYLDVIADILCAWAGKTAKPWLLLLVTGLLILPLSCIRAVANLKFTSIMGICIYGGFGIIVIALYFMGAGRGDDGGEFTVLASGDFLVAVPIQTLAYACTRSCSPCP